MTASQANEFMVALRAGKTIRRITNDGKIGRAIATLTKFQKHCQLYPEWGLQARALAAANAKAANKLKGNHLGSRTHCNHGHDFAVYGLRFKIDSNGRRYRYRKACNLIN
jgi:hypothetical protein